MLVFLHPLYLLQRNYKKGSLKKSHRDYDANRRIYYNVVVNLEITTNEIKYEITLPLTQRMMSDFLVGCDECITQTSQRQYIEHDT